VIRYADRRAAGRALVPPVGALGLSAPMVLALPRGGVPVGAALADALAIPLDVVIARKVGAPGRPELGVGAVAEGGIVVLDHDVDPALVDAQVEAVARRVEQYRGGRPLAVAGHDAVVVDDGIATGVTAEAALRAVRAAGARTVTLAAPVGAPAALERLAPFADHFVCPVRPTAFAAVGQFYDDFDQTSETEVQELLHARHGSQPG
jgi:predicted phosphoribosyltransferase